MFSVYVILGHHYEHLGLMVAMERKKLFDKGKCGGGTIRFTVIATPEINYSVSLLHVLEQ